MRKLMAVSKKFLAQEEGATMVEYGLMVALIAAVCIAVVMLLGQEIRDTFQGVIDAVTGGGS